MDKITILLVDDHKLIRDSWSFLLNNDPRFHVIGESSSADDAVEFAKGNKPDIILMDVNMNPVNGFDATCMMRKHSPRSKVIGVSMHSMPVYAKRMLQMGAMGYITKNSSKEEMINAIIEVDSGKKYICEEVKNILSQNELEEGGSQRNINLLSRRELEIAKLIKEGMSSKEIANKLQIFLQTVEVHRHNILKKVKLKNSAALVNFINLQGL